MQSYAQLMESLKRHGDPLKRLVELTDSQVTLEREMRAMQDSISRMQEAIYDQQDRLRVIRDRKDEAVNALRLQRLIDAGMNEETIRAHFS